SSWPNALFACLALSRAAISRFYSPAFVRVNGCTKSCSRAGRKLPILESRESSQPSRFGRRSMRSARGSQLWSGAWPVASALQSITSCATRCRNSAAKRLERNTVDLDTFFKAEFAEHHDVARRSEQTLSGSFAALVRACATSIRGGGKLMFFGNGGSAADAQHLATELTVRYKRDPPDFAAIALTSDSTALTAAGNDLGCERISARKIEALGKPGDAAVAISRPGRSRIFFAPLKQVGSRGRVPA